MRERPRKNTEQDLLDNSKATQVRLFATTLLNPGEINSLSTYYSSHYRDSMQQIFASERQMLQRKLHE